MVKSRRDIRLLPALLLTLFLVGLPGFLVALPGVARAESAVLVMLKKQFCEWCAKWDEDIATIYPKTWEGRAAPLRRVDIHDDRPQDLTNVQYSRFTPTFILLVDGQEVGRITGYAGEDFFWGQLDELLSKAGIVEPQS